MKRDLLVPARPRLELSSYGCCRLPCGSDTRAKGAGDDENETLQRTPWGDPDSNYLVQHTTPFERLVGCPTRRS
jgi:hypothetical protein